MKKALAIIGSPRRNKNTEKIVDRIVEGLLEKDIIVKKVNLKDLKIAPCTACGYCENEGSCIIDDDMQNLYKDFDESDIIILGSPVYFNTVSTYVKAMIDRCQMFWSSKYVLNKSVIDANKQRKGVFVAVGGAPYTKGQFDACVPVVDLFFKSINTKYSYNILLSNTDKVDITKRQDILIEAQRIGSELVK